MITPLVAGTKPGLLAVIWVVPGDMAVKVARLEEPAPLVQVTGLVIVPTEGIELVKVTGKEAEGSWLVE